MKKTYYFLLTLTALLLSAVNVGAQLVPAADNNSYYYIQFRHNASINAVMEDMGSGNVMQAQTRTLGKDAQLWRVTAGVTQGSYVFTSKLGNKIVWDNGTSRYKTSSTGTGADIKLLYSNNATYTKSFELQRAGSTQAFNVWGGVKINNDIAEYGVGDAGGTVIFVRAPEISSIDNSAERWYWLKSYRDNGKTVNTSNAGATFDNSTPGTFRKFKVVKDAVNNTFGIAYNDGTNYQYVQFGPETPTDGANVTFASTSFTGFPPFEPTATTGLPTGAGSAVGLPGWRINRTSANTHYFHLKASGGGYGLRYYNVKEDANVWNFFDARDVLGENYAEVFAFYNQTTEGNNPGEYSTSARAALKTALDASLALYNNPAALESELLTQSANLTTAFNTYKAAVNLIKASDGTNTYWYQIRDKRSPAVYWNIATVGTTANALGRTTSSNPTANTQLFKFVKAPYPNTGYYIYNKTDAVNALAAPSTNYGDIIRIESSTTPMSIRFENAQTGYYLIITENSNKQLNSFSDKISFYNGGSTDLGNNWKLVELDLTVLKNTYTQKRTEARDLYTATATLEGTYFGQYSAASRSTLDAIVSAEDTKDVETLSFNQLEANIITLQSAIDAFKNSVNNNLNSLFSANPNNNRWYRLKNRFYSSNDIIASNTVAENGGIITQNSGIANDNELWRFELNAGGTAVKIVNKATGLAIKENGTSTQSTLVNLSTATEFVFSRQDIYWAIGRVNATQYQYLHRDESSKLVGWEAIAPASHWTLQYVEETPKPTRTLTVASANPGVGTAVITGTEYTSATTNNPISATATATDPDYFFTNWTNADGGTLVSTSNPYSYTGTTNIDLVANFATNGIPVAPMASTTEHPVYYLIQSASNATHSFNSYTGDFRGNVLISPTTAGILIHNKLSTATSLDHALWQIVNVEGVQLLKNKATGFYMTGSHSVGATGAAANAFTFDLINGSTTQYKLRTADASGSYINTWQNNLADRLSIGDQANSLIAWHFIAPAFTGNTDFSNTTDWTNGVAPTENMAVAINSNAVISADRAFSGLHIAAGKTLTVNAGKGLTIHNSITGSGTLVLKSDVTSGTATVTGNVGGTATVHQAIDKYRSWYMSLPVNNVSGNTGVGSYSTFAESTDTWSVGSALSGVSAGTGVAINPTDNSVTSLSFTGTLNNGDVNLPGLSSGNKRWHYVGNPYPSYLAWSALSKTNLEETVWFRTAEGNTYKYATWNGELGTPYNLISDGVIAPLQGFWVQVKSGQTGSLGFINAMRSHHSAGNKHLRAPQVSDISILRLTVSNGTLSDEAVVYFSALNSDSRDSYDAAKMMNGNNIPEIYTLLNNEALVINAMANISYGVELPLGFNTKVAGNFTISANEFSRFAADDRVLLLDKSNNSLTDLSLGAYSFESGATTTNDRFAIKLVPGSATGIDKTTDGAYIFANNNRQLVVSLAGANEGASIRIYTVAGQQIAAQALTTRVTTLRAPLNHGAYVVEIINGGKQSVQRVIVK